MDTIFLIAAVFFGMWVIVKLFYPKCKSDDVSKKQIQKNRPMVAEPAWKTATERPEMSKKNKWLYPEDGLGKMERGVVD